MHHSLFFLFSLAILRSCFVVSSSVVLATTIFASPLSAAPLRYLIEMTAGSAGGAPHLLAGATFRLDITWDAAAIPPVLSIDNIATLWPLGNAMGSMTVNGSADSDGIYDVAFDSPRRWSWITSNNPLRDVLEFPQMRFEIAGNTFHLDYLRAYFSPSFFNSPPPFNPKAFSSAEVFWPGIGFGSREQPGLSISYAVGSATPVPEPPGLATVTLGVAGSLALRRRK